MSPRIAPLPESEWDEETAALLDGLRRGDRPVLNIFSTLARHPALLTDWLGFGARLLVAGALPARDRELAILRTAWNARTPYEWGQHVRIARKAGVTDEEITRLARADGADDPAWSEDAAAVVRAADELHRDCRIADDTWAALAARYDDQQLIELCMVVGQYHLVAFTLNSLGVELEPGVDGFPA